MSEFKSAVAGLREALKQEGERCAIPNIEGILRREKEAEPSRVLWAMAIASLLAMLAVPLYQGERAKRAAEVEQADMLLFEQVNESLSQPVAAALVPLLGPGK